jgi:tetratricopeptide (TPR) repeat protein
MKIHKRSLPETRKRLKLNWPLLIFSLLILTVLIPAGYFLHRAQMGRVVQAIRTRATQQAEDGEWGQSATTIQSFLLIEPENREYKVKLAEVLDRTLPEQADLGSVGRLNQIIAVQSVALGVCEADPSLADRGIAIRKRLIKRLTQIGRFEDAMNQIAELAGPSSDPFLLKNLALLRYSMALEKRTHSYSESKQSVIPEWLYSAANLQVVDLLLKALIDNPADIELSSAFANACIGQNELIASSQLSGLSPGDLRERAVASVDKMLASQREVVEAWIAHYEIVAGLDPVRAESDIRQLLSMAPNNLVVLKNAGLHYLARAQNASMASESLKRTEWLSSSVEFFRRAIDQGLKDDYRVYLGLGEGLELSGQVEEAIDVWESGARVSKPPTAILWSRLVQVWSAKKNIEQMHEMLKSMDESIRNESNQLSKMGQSVLNRISKQQWASYYAVQGDFLEAANYLREAILNDQDLDSDNRSAIYGSLGQCYINLGQHDLAVDAYQSALALNPKGDANHRGLSQAFLGSNRSREAVEQLGLLTENTAEDHVRICEIVLGMQKIGVQDVNYWNVFDRSFKEAASLIASDAFLIERPWLMELLQLDSALIRTTDMDPAALNQLTQTRLIELSEKFPETLDLQLQVIQRLENLGFSEKSRELLAKVESSKPQDTSLFLLKIDRLLKDGMQDSAKKLLDERLSAEPDNQALQAAAMRIAVGILGRQSDINDVDALQTKNINALINVGRNAVNSRIIVPVGSDENHVKTAFNNWSANVQAFEKQLRDREGLQGTEWRYLRARRLLAESEFSGKTELEEVEILSNYLSRNRSSWNLSYVLSGMLEDVKGNPQTAVREFTRAIRLGEESMQVYERLAELMFSQGQMAELASLLDRLGDRKNQSQKLSSIAIGLSGKDQQSMLGLAKDGILARPRDPMAWVWLGQATELASRSLSGELREQEILKSNEALRNALELASGKSIPVYSAAFGLYLSTKQPEKVEELLESLKGSDIEPTSKQLTLANMYQALDRMDLANNSLLEARKSAKNPTEIDGLIARLYVAQGKQDEAIGLFKVLYESGTDQSGTARRSYVTLLANRGSDADWQTIEKVYENDKYSGNPDDKRLRAELLARKGKPKDLAMAQYLLESLVEDPKNRMDQDRFRLASIYIVNANMAQLQDPANPQVQQLLSLAGKQLNTLTRNPQASIEYLYTYGDFLLNQDRIVEANDIADRLDVQDADHFATAFLRARLQKVSGNSQRATTLILAWKDSQLGKLGQGSDSVQKAEVLAKAGSALSELGADVEAEDILRESFELDATRGANYVRSLAKSEDQNAKQSAIRYLLDKLKKEKTPEVARLLAGLLSVGSIPEELAEQGDEALSAIGSSNENNAELLLSIADMWLAQKKSNKAIDAYRKIVKLKPNDVVALNNLAILLGEQSDGTTEALSLIDQAIRIAGNQPLLLDSKAAILMLANRVDEAIPILEIAASATEDPRVLFHLYLALRRASRDEEADRLKSRVSPVALRKSILTPDDQLELERFEQQTP